MEKESDSSTFKYGLSEIHILENKIRTSPWFQEIVYNETQKTDIPAPQPDTTVH